MTVKVKEQPIAELESLRHHVAELEKLETERRSAAEALQESEKRYRDLYEEAPNMYFWVGVDGGIRMANHCVTEVLGYDLDQLIGRPVFDLYADTPTGKAKARAVFQRFRAGKRIRGEELEMRKEGGGRVWVSLSVRPVRDMEGRIVASRLIAVDITERKQAEEKIKQAAEEWRVTFDSIAELVSIQDKDFKIARVNKAYADAFKMKPNELIGKTCYELVHGTNEPVPNCPHMKTLETRKPSTLEFLEPHLGIYLEVSTSPVSNEKGEVVATVHVARDITERKRMEGSLIITDRLVSIGELASGIAHEINNPLTSVIGFAQLLLDKDVPDDVKEDVRTIYREAQRTAEVVKNLLTFARKHAPAEQLVNVNSIVEKVLELRAYEQKVENIEVDTRFAPDLPEVMADYFQLQQVFLNIIINAEYFMIEAHKRGTLTITTEKVGNIVRTSFADDGPGISKEHLGHLFDPFFTTKEVGKGTGLGLSICHGVVTEHGGRIYAESLLGKGATFVMELPASLGAANRGGDK